MATTINSFLRLRRSPVVTADVDHVPPVRAGKGGKGPTVLTFLGWTPGLRSLVAGRVLGCGCLVGAYETRAGAIIEVLDACGPVCPHAGHRQNAVLNAGLRAVLD
jgi:hypothetical protein